MLIGIMSDTHDSLQAIANALDALRHRGVEHILHAGDFIAPFAVKALGGLSVPVTGVFGNNDGERAGLSMAFQSIGELSSGPVAVQLAGRRIALMHEPRLVRQLARSGEFDLCVFGHTHELAIETDGALMVNPGEVCAYVSGRATLVVLDLATMRPETVELVL